MKKETDLNKSILHNFFFNMISMLICLVSRKGLLINKLLKEMVDAPLIIFKLITSPD